MWFVILYLSKLVKRIFKIHFVGIFEEWQRQATLLDRIK